MVDILPSNPERQHEHDKLSRIYIGEMVLGISGQIS